jgi:hypothetical protein
LSPPTAISTVVGTGINTSSFSLAITGGTNSYAAPTYSYNINGQGYGNGYTVSPGNTSQTPTLTITNGGTGSYASPWTVSVQATNVAGSVYYTLPSSISGNKTTVNNITYNGTTYTPGQLSTYSASSTLATSPGIIYQPLVATYGSSYNIYCFGASNTSGSSTNNYVVNYTSSGISDI